jgi:hypothetical protein
MLAASFMAKDGDYSEDEVRAIIDHALRTDLGRDVSHDELVAVAAEVGISREAIDVAAREIRANRQLEEVKQRVIQRRRRHLASHLSTYAIVNLFLFAINFLTSPGQWWFVFPLLGWGLGMIFHVRAGLSRDVSQRELARERKRLQAERRLVQPELPSPEHVRLAHATEDVSAAVQERVGRILSKAAAELRATGQEARGPRVDPGPDAELEDVEDANPVARRRPSARQ